MSWTITGKPGAGDNLLYSQAGTPSLDLRFASTKSLTDFVSNGNLVTFTRASSGTYVGSDGLIKTATTNEPRFDHNPTTGESLGLLVEEPRTNSLLRSEEFDNASWINQNSTETIDASISTPTGGSNAYRLIDNSSNATHNIYQTTTVAGGTTTTLSVYARQATLRYFRLGVTVSGTDYAVADFDLQTGTVTQTGNGATGTVSNATAQSAGNGWIRCSAVFNTSGANRTAGLHTLNSGTMPISGFGVSPYIGAGGYVHIWGPQLEAGAFPTSYIPTTTAAVTRSADVASITGTNFSSWYGQNEGTLLVNATDGIAFPSTLRHYADLNNNSLTNSIGIVQSNIIYAGIGQNIVAGIYSGTLQAAIDLGTQTVGGLRSAIAYRSNDISASRNGVIGTPDTFATLPTPDRLIVGNASGYGRAINSTISRLTYWPQRLSNSTLQTITQ